MNLFCLFSKEELRALQERLTQDRKKRQQETAAQAHEEIMAIVQHAKATLNEVNKTQLSTTGRKIAAHSPLFLDVSFHWAGCRCSRPIFPGASISTSFTYRRVFYGEET